MPSAAASPRLAEAEKIDRSYLCCVIRLTLLAPEMVEMILGGGSPIDTILQPQNDGF